MGEGKEESGGQGMPRGAEDGTLAHGVVVTMVVGRGTGLPSPSTEVRKNKGKK